MQLQILSTEAWLLWVAVESVHRALFRVYISRHNNILAAEVFLSQIINRMYEGHSIFRCSIWYTKACYAARLDHTDFHPIKKSILERVV